MFKYTEEEGWIKKTTDYIFVAKNDWFEESGYAISQYLDPAELERNNQLNLEIGNPCSTHPSDHYSIGYEVKLKMNVDQNERESQDSEKPPQQDSSNEPAEDAEEVAAGIGGMDQSHIRISEGRSGGRSGMTGS